MSALTRVLSATSQRLLRLVLWFPLWNALFRMTGHISTCQWEHAMKRQVGWLELLGIRSAKQVSEKPDTSQPSN